VTEQTKALVKKALQETKGLYQLCKRGPCSCPIEGMPCGWEKITGKSFPYTEGCPEDCFFGKVREVAILAGRTLKEMDK